MVDSEDEAGEKDGENFEPYGEIVSMVLHEGHIYIATQKRVFKMVRDVFVPVNFVLPKN